MSQSNKEQVQNQTPPAAPGHTLPAGHTPPAGQRPRRGGGGHGPMGGMMPAEKAKDFKGTLRRLMKWLKPQMPVLITVMALAVASTVFAILSPKLIANNITNPLVAAISSGGAAADWDAIMRWIVILIGIYAVSALLSFVSYFVSARMSQGVVYEMRKRVKEKIDKLPLKYFDNNAAGDTLSVITNDMDTIGNTLQQSVTQVITSVITVVGVFIMMLTISGWMTLITVVSVPLFVIITGLIMKKSQSQFVKQQRVLGGLNGHIEEIYSGAVVVKLYGKEEQAYEAFEQYNGELCDAGTKAQFLSGIIHPVLNFVNNIAYVAVCMLGGFLAGQPVPLKLGDIQAFLQYSSSFSQPILQTAQIMNVIQSAVAAAERVFNLLDQTEETPDTAEDAQQAALASDVAFDNVDFSYTEGTELIKGLSLSVEPGASIAIVGPTGAGKTTLVNLLMRFYETDGGCIRIGGKDIREMSRKTLRDRLGMVLQDTWLFSGTVRDNIKYGNPDATDDEVVEAAKKACVHHFITTMEKGYDTVLDESASNISQGQKQLITIARAVLKDPKILILDEATSSVDTRTEAYIQTAMTAMMHGKTSFVIAHRLSTIKNASLILVMNRGAVIEQGSHPALMEKKGFYYELYNSQFAV